MVCDLQEKFAPSIINFDTIVQNTDRIVQAANLLQIPILATEQYPKVIKNFHGHELGNWSIFGYNIDTIEMLL